MTKGITFHNHCDPGQRHEDDFRYKGPSKYDSTCAECQGQIRIGVLCVYYRPQRHQSQRGFKQEPIANAQAYSREGNAVRIDPALGPVVPCPPEIKEQLDGFHQKFTMDRITRKERQSRRELERVERTGKMTNLQRLELMHQRGQVADAGWFAKNQGRINRMMAERDRA